jgi:branched-chain amino acid aminotransferase
MTLPAWIWINGEFRRGEDAAISPFDRGVAHGDGLYETIRGVHGEPLFFEDHWRRFASSATALEIPLPIEAEALRLILLDLVDRNGLSAEQARLKVLLTRGPSTAPPWEMACEQPTLLATAWALVPRPSRPLMLGTVPHRRDAADPIWQHKTTNLLSRGLARAELRRRGLDDGLILNTAEHVCEATTSNLFALVEGRVVTPPLSDGLLPGITRARQLRLFRESRRCDVAEESLSPAVLRRAEAVWLTNAIVPVSAVGSLDGEPIPMTPRGKDLLEWLRGATEASA